MEIGSIPATADHNPELQVHRSLDHMYSSKIIFFVGYLYLYVSRNKHLKLEAASDRKDHSQERKGKANKIGSSIQKSKQILLNLQVNDRSINRNVDQNEMELYLNAIIISNSLKGSLKSKLHGNKFHLKIAEKNLIEGNFIE